MSDEIDTNVRFYGELCHSGADARKTIMDRMVHGPEGSWMFSTCVVHGELNYIETISKTSSRRKQNESNTENNKQSDESTIKSSTTGPQSHSPHDNTMEDASMKKCEKSKSGMRRQPATPFQMGAPRGPNGEAPPHPFLTGPQIREQLIAWAKYGCIEPSVVSSVGKVASYSDATSFVQAKNTIFVLLGATSELGPFDVLSRLGANIAIVSRPGYLTKIQKLVYDAKYKSNCTLYLPVRPRYANVNDIDAESSHCYQEEEYLSTNYMSFESATLTREMGDELGDALDRAGADIITDTPELIEWILNLVKFNPESSDQLNENPDTSAFNRTESGDGSNESVPLTDNRKRLVICNMASLLVPEDQVLVTAGMDLICETVCRYHRNTSLVYYISPNTAHCVSEDASRDSEQRHSEAPLWQKVLQAMPTNMTFQPQGSWPKMPNTGLRVSNGIAGYKGHYYTLSKTSQIWRAMLAKSEGHIVSANLGPSSRTDSMISFKFIRFALEGMQIVQPFVAFDVEPAKTLMAALMLYDLNCDQSTAHPYVRQKHPMCLFLENAVHGGTWRCPFTVDSMGQVSYVVGHFRKVGRSPLNSLSWKEWQGGLPSFIDGYHPKEHDENDCKESIVGSSYSRGSSKLSRRKSARSQS